MGKRSDQTVFSPPSKPRWRRLFSSFLYLSLVWPLMELPLLSGHHIASVKWHGWNLHRNSLCCGRPPFHQKLIELKIDSISSRHKLSSILLGYDCIHTSRTRSQHFLRTEWKKLTSFVDDFLNNIHDIDRSQVEKRRATSCALWFNFEVWWCYRKTSGSYSDELQLSDKSPKNFACF